jgi:hypothetical protein
MWTRTTILVNRLRTIWRHRGQHADAGYASEAVLVTALLIIAALVVIGIVVAKVTSKAESIDLSLLTTVVL